MFVKKGGLFASEFWRSKTMALVSALTWEKRMAGGVIMLQTRIEIIRLDRKPDLRMSYSCSVIHSSEN